MQLDRTKEIIQALADGVDPYTGETFPADGPYQRADTVRALYTALDALESSPNKSRRSPEGQRRIDPNKPNAGGKWTSEEDDRLREEYAANNDSIKDIAKAHGRTPGAISSRLVKLGIIEDKPANRTGSGNVPPPKATPRPADSTAQHDPPPDCPF